MEGRRRGRRGKVRGYREGDRCRETGNNDGTGVTLSSLCFANGEGVAQKGVRKCNSNGSVPPISKQKECMDCNYHTFRLKVKHLEQMVNMS